MSLTYYFLPTRNVFGEGAVNEAGKLMKSLEYSYIVTSLCKVACTCKSGRTGTDNCNLVSVLNFCSGRFDIMLKSIVSNESLKFTDRNSFTFLTADTLSLTLGLLWTYTAADSRKCRR